MKNLIIIILFSLLAVSINAINTNHDTEPISAHEFIGCGMDAKKAIFGLAPLFQMTYYNNKTWTSPHTNITFKVPDQFSVSDDDQVRENVLQNAYSSYQKYLMQFTAHWNFDVDIGVSFASAGYKYNKELFISKQELDTNVMTMLHGHHVWYFYLATLYPPFILKLDSMFEMALNALPNLISNSVDLNDYNEFITTFGTHFLYRSLFGAKINFDAFASRSFVESSSQQWISTQYGFYFHSKLFNVSNGGFKNQSDIHIDKNFLKEINAKVEFYGGDPSLAHLNNLTLWAETIDKLTYPINSTLNGIWELIINNNIKRQTLKTFIINYMNSPMEIEIKPKLEIDDKNDDKIDDKIDVNFDVKIDVKNDVKNDVKIDVKVKVGSEPDLNCIGHGFNELRVKGCLAPLFEYTYSENRTYPNEIFVTHIPDSIMGNINVTMTDTFNGNTWQKWYNTHYSFFGYKSKEIYKFFSEYYQSTRSLVSNWLEISYKSLTLVDLPPLNLDKEFQLALSKLPKIYSSTNHTTRDFYFDFFESFGTAFAYEIVYGGKFTFNIWYNASYISNKSLEWIKKNSHWSFAGFIGGGHGSSYVSKYVDKQFHESLVFDYSYEGGDTQSYSFNQWIEWAKSIKMRQAPIKYRLLPITFAINDKLIVENINAALTDYATVAKQKLNEYIEKIKQ